MMVLALGDNFEFFLQFYLSKSTDVIPHIDASHELFGNGMMLLPRLMSFSFTNFSSVRESLIIKKFTYVQKHQAQK